MRVKLLCLNLNQGNGTNAAIIFLITLYSVYVVGEGAVLLNNALMKPKKVWIFIKFVIKQNFCIKYFYCILKFNSCLEVESQVEWTAFFIAYYFYLKE